MRIFGMLFLQIFFLIASVLGQFTLYARDLETNTKTEIAQVDIEQKKLEILLEIEGEFCIGADIINNDCISYYKGKLEKFGVKVFLNKQDEIDLISLTKSGVTIVPFTEGAKPNLNPITKKKEDSKKVVQKVVVTLLDEDGNEITQEVEQEVEEIIDDRSFIQKNWKWIVIPLILFLVTGQEKPDADKAVKAD